MKQRRQTMFLSIVLVVLVILGFAVYRASSSNTTQAEDSEDLITLPAFPPTPTIGMASETPEALPSGTSLLTDTFTNERAPLNFTIVDLQEVLPDDASDWIIKDGTLSQNMTKSFQLSDLETMAVAGETSWTDYTVSARIYDQKNGTIGLVARRNGNSFYRFRTIAEIYEATPKVVLEKVIDGKATPLASSEGPGHPQREWLSYALNVSGNTITASINGTQVLSATDDTLTSGQVGLYTRAFGYVMFDNVNVTQP